MEIRTKLFYKYLFIISASICIFLSNEFWMWGYYNQLQILLLTFLESGVIGGFFISLDL